MALPVSVAKPRYNNASVRGDLTHRHDLKLISFDRCEIGSRSRTPQANVAASEATLTNHPGPRWPNDTCTRAGTVEA